MKEFSKLEINYQMGYKLYFSLNMSSAFLYAVFWALREFYYGSFNEDYLIKSLNDPDFDILGGNEGFIQKVGDMVELYTPHDDLSVEPGETPTPSAVVSIENLKVLAQDWKTLYEKSAPVMYLIVQDNGWVVLKEQLEE